MGWRDRFRRGKRVWGAAADDSDLCMEVESYGGTIAFNRGFDYRLSVLSSYGPVCFAPVGGLALWSDVAIVGEGGCADSHHIAIAGCDGHAVGWDVAIAGESGWAEAAHAGLALVFVDDALRGGKARASDGGVIAFRVLARGSDHGRVVVGVVGENGIKPDTWYTLDENNKIVEAE
ncbi:hypothetical protein HEQ62_10395 [Haematospirillum jordaniae]|uniref:hypothetical protein n=1 Tax=Haematospirillum jordaniae TaxID=1549855 RepID=UPI001432BEED|nr:hypothetical protein [Haematospirillum jordaniae]NKD45987.1 hypothetical protein [Haematospirillum jordaniae]NKD60180.1 hypothetical protein [Haematospirillum jordaniae]NKD82229.1 hypothetical protein [Haematospirillum jordaniae]NKD90909.1 hypothetical protein [Haematospirillum jordaniae]